MFVNYSFQPIKKFQVVSPPGGIQKMFAGSSPGRSRPSFQGPTFKSLPYSKTGRRAALLSFVIFAFARSHIRNRAKSLVILIRAVLPRQPCFLKFVRFAHLINEIMRIDQCNFVFIAQNNAFSSFYFKEYISVFSRCLTNFLDVQALDLRKLCGDVRYVRRSVPLAP